MKVKQRLFSFLIAGLIIFPAISTFADTKIYPGSMGAKWSSSNTEYVIEHGAIGNPSSTQRLGINLPVINDNVGGLFLYGTVTVVDRNDQRFEDIRCNLNSRFYSGSRYFGWYTPTQHSTNRGNSQQDIRFPAIPSNILAHYYFNCTIPERDHYSGQRSWVVSYKVDE